MRCNKSPLEIKKDIEFHFDIKDLDTRYRGRNEVMSRYLYYYLCQKFTLGNLVLIGKCVKRDHSTVIRGLKTFPILLSYFPKHVYIKEKLEKKYLEE
jgi:chromosomal replication initiation ATPase DnaA